MSVAYSHYPELHALVDRLRPERADEARRTRHGSSKVTVRARAYARCRSSTARKT